MKKAVLAAMCLPLLHAAEANAQTVVKGPSSSSAPYVLPVAPGVKITSVLTVGDTISGYRMTGIPDGLGAFDNNDGTFTLLMNHELGKTSGTTRAHGSTGTFVSRWIIRKSDLKVLSGSDLMQRVNLWNVAAGRYFTYYSSAPSASAAFDRFCSGDLAPVSAYYNAKTGKGTLARIYMNGEETGAEGRAMAHVASGPDAGSSYEVPRLGKASWENFVGHGYESDSTVLIGMDDATPGQVYVYIGAKTNSGLEIEKAGLTNGKLFGIAVSGLAAESGSSVPTPGTAFSLVDLGDVSSMTGATINTNSNSLGITTFLRPEDGSWDPANDSVFYFNTTNSLTGPSRLWKLQFTNPASPSLGGKITAVLDGTEGQKMMDNLTVDHFGHALIVEDVGNNVHLGRVMQYDFAKDTLTVLAQHDSAMFLSGGSKYLTQDEEASGILDVQEILGAGMYLCADQAHYSIAGELAEGGQLFALFNPDSYNANPEISISGNGLNISNGDLFPTSMDNTDFGNIDTGMTVTKAFYVKNAGPAALKVSGVSFGGAHAGDFSLTAPATFPATVAAGDSLRLNVKFAPMVVGLRTASIQINSNDFDEKVYSFSLQGVALNNRTSVAGLTADASFLKLFPNPTGDAATVSISLKKAEHYEFTIVDMNGRQVMETVSRDLNAGDNQVHINTSTLPNGNYIVRVASANQTVSVKMVIAH
ncbi:choice-of-anchor D domain-containing protein [Rurimicrobium arvi]|uniref:Choice-of-anchor D domain-containing protein n=1 Tax=Rurimicrobium arvi TaxID=2049916 RepID=A0ABP8N0J6_9BACT